MKPSLGLRASQQLALTPQLQLSIRLLQMSTAELELEVEHYLAQNPLLETAESAATGSPQEPLSSDAPTEDLSASERTEEALPGSAESWSVPAPKESSDHENDWANQRAQPICLRDHLHEQAHGLALSERDMAWLETLIDSLDEDGYLREPLEELEASIAEEFVGAFHERLDADEQQLGLRLLQSMEPAGVGARSLQECLSLQLDRLLNATAGQRHGEGAGAASLAQQIVGQEDLLQALGAHDFKGLCQRLHCDRDVLRLAVQLIQGLNPRPGAPFQHDAAETVIPDVIAYRTQAPGEPRWQVRLHEAAVPRLSINPVYADMIRQNRASPMAAQLQEARWLIKNIQQRFDTILRVAQAIAAEQQLFFEQGEQAMKPLVLRDIAQRCELHESTVSRVTHNKYILTPRGTFELKYFFTSHVGTDGGGSASSASIRATLKRWVAEEDPQKPLSDQQIADRFALDGVHVARRTIAKYREALRIEPVSHRRKL